VTGAVPGAAANAGVPALITAAARAFPERTAVVCGGGQLSFRDLDRLSDVLRDRIVATGVPSRTVLGLCAGRGLEQVIALVAILKAGCAYLPLDPRQPPPRLQLLVAEAGAELILVAPGCAAAGRSAGRPVLPVKLADLSRAGTSPAPAGEIAADDLAYVLCTSGSTGRPKAVEITHGNVTALIRGLEQTVWRGLGHCRVAWNAAASFDASVQQWTRLCRGDTLVLLDERTRTDPVALVDHLVRHGVTDLDVVPSHLAHLLPTLRDAGLPIRLLVGGEPVPAGLWDELVRLRQSHGIRAWNLYGPTECTVDSTTAEITGGPPHLGCPLPHLRCYVLGPGLAPVAPGATGELFIAGAGVGRGYRGAPGRTAAAFLPDVVHAGGGRMYRTGDLVRLGVDGRLEFLRRRDRQVKVRGHRIELGEVEAALLASPLVVAAAAVLRTDLPAGTGFAAYVVTAGRTSASAVREAMCASLPAHLLPAAVIVLDRLPTRANGKVDHGALPAVASVPPPADPAPAADPIEHTLVEIWRQVVPGAVVGVESDFFDLGGDSLTAARVSNRCRERLGVRVPARWLFDHPVLRDFAAVLRRHVDSDRTPTPAEITVTASKGALR
jgi:amino acid adenylation domain-containing protein